LTGPSTDLPPAFDLTTGTLTFQLGDVYPGVRYNNGATTTRASSRAVT
jgi:hypothetical protein